jgi:hypothetical protein
MLKQKKKNQFNRRRIKLSFISSIICKGRKSKLMVIDISTIKNIIK